MSFQRANGVAFCIDIRERVLHVPNEASGGATHVFFIAFHRGLKITRCPRLWIPFVKI